MVAFYAGLGIAMITGIMAIVEMSMGFVVQQNRWESINIYSKISAASLDRYWLQVLNIVNNVNDLALWDPDKSDLELRDCTCDLLKRSVFSESIEPDREVDCLLGLDTNSQAIFPSDLISKEFRRPIQSSFVREVKSPATSFLTSCDFKRLADVNINGINVTVKHRVLIFPDRVSETLKLYSCAFDGDDPDQNQCSFEKS